MSLLDRDGIDECRRPRPFPKSGFSRSYEASCSLCVILWSQQFHAEICTSQCPATKTTCSQCAPCRTLTRPLHTYYHRCLQGGHQAIVKRPQWLSTRRPHCRRCRHLVECSPVRLLWPFSVASCLRSWREYVERMGAKYPYSQFLHKDIPDRDLSIINCFRHHSGSALRTKSCEQYSKTSLRWWGVCSGAASCRAGEHRRPPEHSNVKNRRRSVGALKGAHNAKTFPVITVCIVCSVNEAARLSSRCG